MTPWLKQRLGAWVLLPLLSAPLAAQTGVQDKDPVQVEVTTLLQQLREAAAQHDWDQIAPHFPVDSLWQQQVRTAVEAEPWPAGRASFWAAETEVDWGRVRMIVLARDIVGVSAPFATKQTTGTFGAVLTLRDGVWTFHCSVSLFPQANLEPGCASAEQAKSAHGAG